MDVRLKHTAHKLTDFFGHGKLCSLGSSQSETFTWSRSKLQPQCPKILFSPPAATLHSVMRRKAVHNTINGAITLLRSNRNAVKRQTAAWIHLERIVPKICADCWALINLWLNVNVLLWDGCENPHPPKSWFLLSWERMWQKAKSKWLSCTLCVRKTTIREYHCLNLKAQTQNGHFPQQYQSLRSLLTKMVTKMASTVHLWLQTCLWWDIPYRLLHTYLYDKLFLKRSKLC